MMNGADTRHFAAYQAGELDSVEGAMLSPAENDIIAADP